MSNLAKTVKSNIIRILGEQGVSRNELSRRTGIAQSTMVVMLNGESEILTDTIQRIAEALEVEISDLIVGSRLPKTPTRRNQAVSAA